MQVEIYKTKTKLTKSMVNQMQKTGKTELFDGICLGYVVNVFSHISKIFLISHGNTYSVLPSGYKKGAKCFYRRYRKGSIQWNFSSEDDCDKAWKKYTEIKENAVQIYL